MIRPIRSKFLLQLSRFYITIKNVKIYVFNQGLSDEWFRDFNELAEQLDSELVNISLDQVTISPEWLTQDHISSAAYARYFIPQFVAEERVLYLDSDLCGQ